MGIIQIRTSRVLLAAILGLVVGVAKADAEGALPGPGDYLASIRPSDELQGFLDETVEALAAGDPKLRQSDLRIALLDMSHGEPPRLAQRQGESPIYPASVVKLVYLMAAYAWQEAGQLRIGDELDQL